MTCYFHFSPYFPHGSGRQMSDNGMWDPAEGCVPPASLCMFLVRPCIWWAVSAVLSQGILWFLLAKQCGLHMTNQICQTASVFPPHVQQENLASIIIAPQGELPKFLPSSFVRNEALSFPAIGWNMSFDIKSHRFPLAAWPRQMFIIFIYVIGDDPAAQQCRDLAADSHVMLIMSKRLS